MSLTDDFGQSPLAPRNLSRSEQDAVRSPVVRTASSRSTLTPDTQPAPSETYADAGPARSGYGEPVPPPHPAYAPPPASPMLLLNLAMVLGGLWTYRRLAVVLMAIFAIVGAMGLPLLPKKYSAETSVYFDPRSAEIAQSGSNAAPASPEAISATIDSQTRILTSGVIMKRVASRLGLNKDPDFVGTTPVTGDEIPPVVLDKLEASVESKREQSSYIVTLRVQTKNPQKSADIANTIVQEFMQEEAANLSGIYNTMNATLDNRLVDMAANVQKADQAVEDYKAKNDLITADGNLISDKRLSALNELLVTAQNKTIEAKSRVDFVAKLGLDSGGNDKETADNTSVELANLRRQYTDQQAKVASLQSQLGSRHPSLQAAQAALEGIRRQVQNEQARVLDKARSQLSQAQQTERDIAQQLNVQKTLQNNSSNRLVQLKELQRKADAARAVYEALLKRSGETTDQSQATSSNIRIISEAVAPLKADGPAKTILMVAGGFGGLLLGLGLAILISLIFTLRSASRARAMRI